MVREIVMERVTVEIVCDHNDCYRVEETIANVTFKPKLKIKQVPCELDHYSYIHVHDIILPDGWTEMYGTKHFCSAHPKER